MASASCKHFVSTDPVVWAEAQPRSEVCRGGSPWAPANLELAEYNAVRYLHTCKFLKRNGGLAAQDAAKIAGPEGAEKMRNSRQPERLNVGRIMVGQNEATRY